MMSSVDPNSRTCVLAPHAKVQDSATQHPDDPPIKHSGNSTRSILEKAEVDECIPGPVSKNSFCCRNIDKEYTDADEDS